MRICCIYIIAASVSFPGLGATTINSVNKYAYGANIGWINAEGDVTNGVVAGELSCSGFAYGANVGWVHFGAGPQDGHQYSNLSSADFGVNVEPDGALRGFAYGANVGWIIFEANGDPNINLLDGTFGGSAYGANIGWISLSNLFAAVQTDSLDPGPDTDLDMIPDAWEYGHTNTLAALGAGDSDLDGVSDADEYRADTDPFDAGDHLRATAGIDGTLTWRSEQTRLYLLFASDVLGNPTAWMDAGPGLLIPDTGTETTRSVLDPGATRRFYKVGAIVPLAP